MADFTVNERTRKLMETISEIVDKEDDVGIFKLQKQAPERLKKILAQTDDKTKPSMEDLLKERQYFDSRTGEESVDLLGRATNKDFSSVTDFDADEIRENLQAMRERSARLQEELGNLQTLIEDKIVNADPKKVEATIDIRKDANLRNAVRRVFGDKKKTITFEDYKKALQLKTRFDKEEVEATASDKVKF